MTRFEGCQLPCLPEIAEGNAKIGPQPLKIRLKRSLAAPWNYYIKKNLKQILVTFSNLKSRLIPKTTVKPVPVSSAVALKPGDLVRVRSREEIQATLNSWKELKGCAFLEYMWQYCGTTQRVLKPLERFLDERDYKVKKTRGVILLEGVYCTGTPVFGQCDRSCLLFWREEWLEKIA
jgi:hypothetical protein